ncbi:MAG: KpsF/GutQ family sugar-phosphate isomerase [Chlamydiae bacterium]|nr:KpsF/GutQ family sugar-phosphate isomerase [Chlamydiota bacterium]
MVINLFKNAQSYLNHFFDTVNIQDVEVFIKACQSSEGLLVLTGVGKSGIIAEKIAMTLISTGTRALFLPAMNFLHGDIGIVSEKDVVIMISKSGESEELLNLIPFFKKKGAKLLGIVSKPSSRLASQADLHICLPVEKELCGFDLVPTTSTVVQLIFGDILAVALMQNRKFNLEEYAKNHPSGSIGKKLTLTVKDIMLKEKHIPLCSPKDKLSDVLVELSNKRCGALLIANEQSKLLGIFTDGDLRRSLQSKGSSVLEEAMEDLMNPAAFSLNENVLAWDALKYMQKDPFKWVMVLPVLERDRIVGVLRMHDIVQSGIS